MRKIIITEEQFNKLLSEQITGNDTNSRQSKFELGFTIKLDASIFKNGVDTIDVNNPQFVNTYQRLKKTPNNYNITIEGGASAVGNSNGYNNNALANRRATNFVNTLKRMGVNTSNYNITTKVGVATVKDSPEAQKEQYIKVIVKKPYDIKTAIDNTAVKNNKVNSIDRNKLIKNIPVSIEQYITAINLLKKNGINIS